MLIALTRPEVAARLGLKEGTLRVWATKGRGPKFVKLGLSQRSPVRFLEAEVDRYLADPEAYEREQLSRGRRKNRKKKPARSCHS